MKKLLFATFIVFFTICTQAQLSQFRNCIGNKYIANLPVIPATGMEEKAAENITWACKKLWKNNISISDSNRQNKPFAEINLNQVIAISNNKKYTYSGFYADCFSLDKHQTGLINPFRSTAKYQPFEIPFDNIAIMRHPDRVLGADRNEGIIANKALTYTMLYCYLASHFNNDYGNKNQNKHLNKTAFKEACKKGKEKLKGVTILVPQELIDIGLNEESLKKNKIRYKIETSEQIARRIKSGKDVQNYAHYLYWNEGDKDYGLIVDIEDGELLSYSSRGRIFKKYKTTPKRVMKMLNKLHR